MAALCKDHRSRESGSGQQLESLGSISSPLISLSGRAEGPRLPGIRVRFSYDRRTTYGGLMQRCSAAPADRRSRLPRARPIGGSPLTASRRHLFRHLVPTGDEPRVRRAVAPVPLPVPVALPHLVNHRRV